MLHSALVATWGGQTDGRTERQTPGYRHNIHRAVHPCASRSKNQPNAYADKYQREVVSNAILSVRNADHRILRWTGASAEDLAHLSAHDVITNFIAYERCHTHCTQYCHLFIKIRNIRARHTEWVWFIPTTPHGCEGLLITRWRNEWVVRLAINRSWWV